MSRASPQVFLNSLAISDQKSATRTLVHELVHAYDHSRVYLDYGDCRHLACTEVRGLALRGCRSALPTSATTARRQRSGRG